MSIFTYQQWAADSVHPAVIADGLRNRENVVLVKRPVERRAAVPARTEADQLTRVIRFWMYRIVLMFEPHRVYQVFGLSGTSRHRM
jgi:hypothetical protein